MNFDHKSVLLQEAVEGLNIDPNGVYVDATFGGGGHTELILSHLDQGKLIAFDQDFTAIQYGRDLLKEELESGQLTLIHANFSALASWLDHLKVNEIDGIIYDLGVSSPQFDQGERGFSYRYDARLDMRMNQEQELTAYQIVNEWPYDELVRVLYRYGEEHFSKQIARAIERQRATQPIETTFDLVEIIKDAIPAPARRKGGHPAKRTFQALRIAVNDELNVFEQSLEQAIQYMSIGGRISVITFHSLEDRLCKQMFREYAKRNELPKNLPLMPEEVEQPILKLINKKAIRPTDEEMSNNHRSRSARLRIAEKRNQVSDGRHDN